VTAAEVRVHLHSLAENHGGAGRHKTLVGDLMGLLLQPGPEQKADPGAWALRTTRWLPPMAHWLAAPVARPPLTSSMTLSAPWRIRVGTRSDRNRAVGSPGCSRWRLRGPVGQGGGGQIRTDT